MDFSGDIDRLRQVKAAPGVTASGWPAGAVVRRALVVLLGAGLVGCGSSGGAGSLLVDPGRYSAYHCNDLAARWKVLVAREKELRELMDRADQGGGGAVIGSLAYRPDYDSVLGEERLLQRTAAEKNCSATQQFQSDQIIR
jgi:hypothetical protein